MRLDSLSIRTVLVTLGCLAIVIATSLAGFGVLATTRQFEARERVAALDSAVQNHAIGDASLDDVRADVQRALLSSLGLSKQTRESIFSEYNEHLREMREMLGRNAAAALSPELHDLYAKLFELMPDVIAAGTETLNVAFNDPVQGPAAFERFRQGFGEFDEIMDTIRDQLRAEASSVRGLANATFVQVRWVILGSFACGIALLILITAAAIRISGRITDALARSREEAERLALHDTLTDLPNRAYLGRQLTNLLDGASRHGTTLAVLCVDLDRFKQVNDTLGHPVGDELLRVVAARLRGCVRPTDIAARLGGDEFAVVQTLLGCAEEAGMLAQRLVDVLSAPYELQGHQVVVGASVGLALAPTDAMDGNTLLKMADMALYRAKADGRGVFRSFEPDMDAKLQARRILELDLRRGLAVGEFELHYQPLVDVASGRVASLEALVRWHHPERGLVSPDGFIPLAEEVGLIEQLGAWVLRQACADTARWPDGVRVAVNVAATQFRNPGLSAIVLDALTAAGLPPDRLELEITETALLAHSELTLRTLHELRAKGVRIAMDDFGTGYSSLGYLRSFPFDKIKIDRSFVRDMQASADCRAIVRAVTGLGCNLGLATTAEGVETGEQLSQLLTEGCTQLQGYLFSRPVPADKVPALLKRELLGEHEPAPEADERAVMECPR